MMGCTMQQFPATLSAPTLYRDIGGSVGALSPLAGPPIIFLTGVPLFCYQSRAESTVGGQSVETLVGTRVRVDVKRRQGSILAKHTEPRPRFTRQCGETATELNQSSTRYSSGGDLGGVPFTALRQRLAQEQCQ